jgi:hypothetical protein
MPRTEHFSSFVLLVCAGFAPCAYTSLLFFILLRIWFGAVGFDGMGKGRAFDIHMIRQAMRDAYAGFGDDDTGTFMIEL